MNESSHTRHSRAFKSQFKTKVCQGNLIYLALAFVSFFNMLPNLPTEVFLEISRLVDFQSKLNLIKTCRRLNNLISKTTLFENLCVRVNKLGTRETIELFRSRKINGSQVKILDLKMQDLSREVTLQLPDIFPNLTSVSSMYSEYDEDHQRMLYYDKCVKDSIVYNKDNYISSYKSTIKQFVGNRECNWINTIRKYGHGSWHAILDMIKEYTFPSLVDLIIEGHYVPEHREGKVSDGVYLVPYLKNTPCLKKLSLRTWSFSIE